MTPIPSSYLSRILYHQRWTEPAEAPAPAGTSPRGGRPLWPALRARGRRAVAWIEASARVVPAALRAPLREAGR